MWKSGRRPSYSAMRMNEGDVIVALTPRPTPIALARCVLPAPRSPHRQMRSPASATDPSARPSARRGVGVRADDRPLEDVVARVATAHANRSRSPSATVATVPSSSRMRPDSRCTSPSNRRRPAGPSQRPSRPSSGPPRTRTKSAGGQRQAQFGRIEDERRRVADDRDLAAVEHLEDVHERPGHRTTVGAVHDRGRHTTAGDGGRRAGGPRTR